MKSVRVVRNLRNCVTKSNHIQWPWLNFPHNSVLGAVFSCFNGCFLCGWWCCSQKLMWLWQWTSLSWMSNSWRMVIWWLSPWSPCSLPQNSGSWLAHSITMQLPCLCLATVKWVSAWLGWPNSLLLLFCWGPFLPCCMVNLLGDNSMTFWESKSWSMDYVSISWVMSRCLSKCCIILWILINSLFILCLVCLMEMWFILCIVNTGIILEILIH